MSDSRVLTRRALVDALKLLSGSPYVVDAVSSHDSAQREEIDRIRERLKEALDGWDKSDSDLHDGRTSDAYERIKAIRAEVFGQEGK